jgi:hypothetical protein
MPVFFNFVLFFLGGFSVVGFRSWKILEHASSVDKNRQITMTEWEVLNNCITG